MAVHDLLIPVPWRHLVGGRAAVPMEGDTVAEVLQRFTTAFPAFGEMISDGKRLRRSVLILVGNTVVPPAGLHAPLAPGLSIRIMFAYAGG